MLQYRFRLLYSPLKNLCYSFNSSKWDTQSKVEMLLKCWFNTLIRAWSRGVYTRRDPCAPTKTRSAQHQLSGRRSVMAEVKTGPFICSCWAKCILGSQSGGIAPDCAVKAREPICGGKCHHVTPPRISASFSVPLVPCRALQLQLFLHICIGFSSVLTFYVSLPTPIIMSTPVFQISYYLPLKPILSPHFICLNSPPMLPLWLNMFSVYLFGTTFFLPVIIQAEL